MIAEVKKETRLDKFKTHIKRNENLYIVGAVCLTVGVTGGALLAKGRDVIHISDTIDTTINIEKARKINKTVIELVEKSTPSKPVHLVGTNLYFNSLSEAARETGHQLCQISKNANGHIPDVKGDVFEFLESAV